MSLPSPPTPVVLPPHGAPLWAFTGLMLLAVGAWSAWGAYTDYASVVEQEYRLLELRARHREARISGSLRSVNLMLGSIIDDLQDDPRKSPAPTKRLLQHYLRQLPELRSLLIADASGRISAANNENVIGYDASQREYVATHRAAPASDGFHLSQPFKTITGITAVTLSRGMRDAQGRFSGVVVATLESSFFDAALRHDVAEPGVASLLINRQGDVLNSAPSTSHIGKNLDGGVAFTAHRNSGRATTRHLNEAKLAPVVRMAIFHDVPDAPLTVISSRDYDNLLGEWHPSLVSHVGSFALLALATLFLTTLAARRQRALAISQQQLAAQLAEISALQARLQDEVIRDPLTGLYNRRYLSETLPRELARARREGGPLALIMIDLDHFKAVNDAHGHAAGDEVLKALATIVGRGAREGDIVCRYGGEEFLVVLSGMSVDLAVARVDAWRREFSEKPSQHGGRTLSVTLSAGIAGFPADGSDLKTLLLRADQALYRAKTLGRDRVSCFAELRAAQPETAD